MSWRIGRNYNIHIYEGDRPVATFRRPEDAARCVEAVNEYDAINALHTVFHHWEIHCDAFSANPATKFYVTGWTIVAELKRYAFGPTLIEAAQAAILAAKDDSDD